MALESDQSIAQTARDLGVNSNTLHTWISQYKTPKGGTEIADSSLDEVKRLKKEPAKVIQERDLLKKATAYFAREIR